MRNEKENWTSLNIKEKLAIITACVAFSAGWILTGIAAFVPLFLSEASVLTVLGQSLVYAASVFGITSYFNAEAHRMRSDFRRMMKHPQEIEIETEDDNNDETL